MTSDWIDTSHGHGSDWEQRVRQLRVVMTEQRCKEPHFNAAYLCCWTLMIGEMMMPCTIQVLCTNDEMSDGSW